VLPLCQYIGLIALNIKMSQSLMQSTNMTNVVVCVSSASLDFFILKSQSIALVVKYKTQQSFHS
jgi:hypothetical protein